MLKFVHSLVGGVSINIKRLGTILLGWNLTVSFGTIRLHVCPQHVHIIFANLVIVSTF